MARKAYVSVIARFEEGCIQPIEVEWEDGTRFEVDRILDMQPAASLKAGGQGIRYTVRIRGKETYLFLEENQWFVEAKR